jgi:hypothetical protein
MTYTPLNTFAPGQTGFAAKLNNEVAHLGAYTDTNAPTSGQLLALAGTTGTPSNTNRYVTDSDTRLGGVVTAASTPKIRTTGTDRPRPDVHELDRQSDVDGCHVHQL